eukprot:CAMPEP_0195016306 /NCGR_PEP_ID=MMETSP0326_2-20130528/23753_1 /TAXON_ID=2866 ORGANISM="Crypthecodinium cohnii, Strain Seligo" /NCGR_SAMPLE_ID=MMETSP0326_2 /ASSEMBLY_ACC=CAM_ASM_000348 /LENGTH=72 /DNA_ID=CAMNT_0040031787 /DNA_START=101 /DNA_END=319 /DNA_ORIENTATION=+
MTFPIELFSNTWQQGRMRGFDFASEIVVAPGLCRAVVHIGCVIHSQSALGSTIVQTIPSSPEGAPDSVRARR